MAGDPTVFLLYEIGLLIIVSSLVAGLFKKLNLPGLIGAILVGLFIGGPGGIGLVTDLAVINVLAVLGAVLLLFTTGLEFEVSTFWKAGGSAFLLTTAGVALSILCGYAVGIALGWSGTEAFLLGAVIAPSGTSVVAAVLNSGGVIRTRSGSTLLTACVIDDVEGLIVLTVALGVIASGTVSPVGLAGVTLLSMAFIVGSLVIGSRLLPRVIRRFQASLSEDTLFGVLLGLGLVLAFAATLVGLAAVTGAFIVGAIIPYKPVGERLSKQLLMMKDVFTAIFFTSIGLMINPFDIPGLLPIALLVLLVGIGARLIGGYTGGRAGGIHGKALLAAIIGLGVRAEMSLIIAREAVALGFVGSEFLALTTTVVIGSILLAMPILSRMTATTNDQDDSGQLVVRAG